MSDCEELVATVNIGLIVCNCAGNVVKASQEISGLTGDSVAEL